MVTHPHPLGALNPRFCRTYLFNDVLAAMRLFRFDRQGYSMPITNIANDYQPGDIVTWELSPRTTHIGIVLENQDVFHNMGPTSRIESAFLFNHKIIGHYRIGL